MTKVCSQLGAVSYCVPNELSRLARTPLRPGSAKGWGSAPKYAEIILTLGAKTALWETLGR